MQSLRLAFELFHPDGVVRLIEGMSSVDVGSSTFEPCGSLLRVSDITEQTADQANSLTINLVGMPADLEQLGINSQMWGILNDPRIRFAPGNLYLCVFDLDTDALLNVVTLFRGYVNRPSVNIASAFGIIEFLSWEGLSRFSFGYNLTKQHHNTLFPNDRALDFAHYDFIHLGEPDED